MLYVAAVVACSLLYLALATLSYAITFILRYSSRDYFSFDYDSSMRDFFRAPLTPAVILRGDQAHRNFKDAVWLSLDAISWALLGSRLRSSVFMSKVGLAGEESAERLESTSLALHPIDIFLRYHPFGDLG